MDIITADRHERDRGRRRCRNPHVRPTDCRQHGRFLNEDGYRNARVDGVAEWLEDFLRTDLAAWAKDPTLTELQGLMVDAPANANDAVVGLLAVDDDYRLAA